MIILNGKVATMRVRVFMDTPQSGIVLGLSGIELRSQAGGANLATLTGSAFCAPAGSNPGNAVDSNPATAFTANTNAVWWEYRLTSLRNIELVTLIARNDASFGQAPTQLSIGLQDERGRWPIVKSVIGLQWAQGSSIAVPVPIAWGPQRFWNLSALQSIYSA